MERLAHKSEEELLRSRKRRRSKEKKRGGQVKSRSKHSKKHRYESPDSSVDSSCSGRSHTPSRSKHRKKAKSRSKSSKKKKHRHNSSDSDSSFDSSDGDRSPTPSKHRKRMKKELKRAAKHKHKKLSQDKKWAPADLQDTGPTAKLSSAGQGASKYPSVTAASEGSSKRVSGEGGSTNLKVVLAAQTAKVRGPMTREEYEKQQSIVRRVYDSDTGRHRLVKGDGEIIEEIVSRDRQKAINKQATMGDGVSFQAQMKKLL